MNLRAALYNNVADPESLYDLQTNLHPTRTGTGRGPAIC